MWDQAQCDARLAADAGRFAAQVERLIGGAATSDNQFDALVSFAYNLGATSLHGSTLLKEHLAGNYAGAQAQFARWDRAGGRVMAGLARRRAAEAALYSGGGLSIIVADLGVDALPPDRGDRSQQG